MANPLATLRRYQFAFLVFFGLVCMLVFVIGDPLDTWLRSRSGAKSTENKVVVSWTGGEIRENELGYTQSVRNVIREFIRRLQEETQKKNGQSRVAPLSLSPREEDIVYIRLLAQRAEDSGMVVTDEMALLYLQQLTATLIPRAGIGSLFKESVGGRITEHQLIREIKLELLAQNYLSLIYPDLTQGQLPSQAWEYHRRLNRKLKAEVLPVTVASLADKVTREPADTEIEALFAESKDRYPDPASPDPGFRRHRTAAFAFVRADRKKFEEDETAKLKPAVTDPEIVEYYDKNKVEFRIVEPPVGTPAQPGTPDSVPASDPNPAAEKKPTDSPATPANPPPVDSPPAQPARVNQPTDEKQSAGEKKPVGEEKPAGTEKPAGETGSGAEPAAQKPATASPPAPEKSPTSTDVKPDPAPPAGTTSEPPSPCDEDPPAAGTAKSDGATPITATPNTATPDAIQPPSKGQENPPSTEKASAEKAAAEKAAAEKSAAEKSAAEKASAEKASAEKSAAEKSPAAKGAAAATEPAQPPASTPPASTPPASTPPASTPPASTPPASTPPASTPPASTPPANTPPASTPPASPESPAAGAVPPAVVEPKYKPLDDTLKTEIRERIAKQKAARVAQERLDSGFGAIGQAAERYGRNLRTAELAGTPAPEPLDLAKLAEAQGMTAGNLPLANPTKVQETELGKTRGFDFSSMSFEPIPFHRLAYRDGIPLWKPDQIRGGASEGNPDVEFLYWKTQEEEPFVPELKDVRDEVVLTWKLRQAVSLAEAEAKSLAEKARAAAKPLKELFTDNPAMKVAETNAFSWMTRGFLPVNMGGSPTLSAVDNVDTPGEAFMRSVFALKPGEVGTALNQPRSVVYVVRVVSEFPDEETLREQFLQSGNSVDVQQIAFFDRADMRRNWLESLRRELNVKWERTPQS